MFKKGQLVRSKNTGRIYLVEGYDPTGFYVRGQTVRGPIYTLGAPNSLLTLIGNNYQAKPKCSR